MIEASRELACLGHAPDVMNEEIHKVFVGACSETDHLPIGAVRDLRNPQVLEEKDREIADMEARWKDRILAACKSILAERSNPMNTVHRYVPIDYLRFVLLTRNFPSPYKTHSARIPACGSAQ